MRVKLRISSPLAPTKELKILWPLPSSILHASSTIVDLVYAVHESFPWFFHADGNLECKQSMDETADFDPTDYFCETPDGWKLCFWFPIQDTIQDGEELNIGMVQKANKLIYLPYSSVAITNKAQPERILPKLNSFKISSNEQLGLLVDNFDKYEKSQVEEQRKRKRTRSVSQETNSSGSKKNNSAEIEVNGTENNIQKYTAPFQGTAATKSRNARRRKAKRMRKIVAQAATQHENIKLTSEMESKENDNECEEGISKTDDICDSMSLSEEQSAIVEEGIGIMDKIGSHIQNALSTLSSAVISVHSTPKVDIKKQSIKDMNSMIDKDTSDIYIAESSDSCDGGLSNSESSLEQNSDITGISAEHEFPERRKLKLLAESVECIDSENCRLRIPPFPFRQVNYKNITRECISREQITDSSEYLRPNTKVLKENSFSDAESDLILQKLPQEVPKDLLEYPVATTDNLHVFSVLVFRVLDMDEVTYTPVVSDWKIGIILSIMDLTGSKTSIIDNRTELTIRLAKPFWPKQNIQYDINGDRIWRRFEAVDDEMNNDKAKYNGFLYINWAQLQEARLLGKI
ncbi:hypothetical protein V1511DRAFT_509176 [Dipodascopsis uninucleata]